MLPTPDHARNMRLIGHSDQGGRPDGVQVMVHRGHAYVGHMFSKGFSVVDVRDPKRPRPVHYEAAPPGTWNIHLQTHDDLLLVINAKDMFADLAFADERAYYSGSIGKTVGTAEGARGRARDWTAGLAVFDIARPEDAAPHRVHAGGGRGHPPALVRRRAVGLRVRAPRRVQRLHLPDDRHGRSDADPGRPAGSGCRGCTWRPARSRPGRPAGGTACTTRSSTETRRTAPGAMPASS